MDAVEKLRNLTDALVEDLLEAEDDELLEDCKAQGIDPHALAEDMRRMVERMIREKDFHRDEGEM